MQKHKNLSIFVPHQGCPNQCAFCDQRSITGMAYQPTPQDVRSAVMTALDSLKEKSPEREIVESSERFVDEVKNIAKEFINKPRMELKAKLGVTFAVLSPICYFHEINVLHLE